MPIVDAAACARESVNGPNIAAPAAAPTIAATGYVEYTVQKGDILGRIAQKYDVSVREILAINDIANPDSLTVGQVLRIPQK